MIIIKDRTKKTWRKKHNRKRNRKNLLFCVHVLIEHIVQSLTRWDFIDLSSNCREAEGSANAVVNSFPIQVYVLESNQIVDVALIISMQYKQIKLITEKTHKSRKTTNRRKTKRLWRNLGKQKEFWILIGLKP